MKDKDEANYMLSKKAEIMKLQQEMWRLSRRLQKEVISERAQEISKRIKEIREKMEDSGSVIKRLKSDKTHLYDESTSNIRAVGVFTFDNER